MPPWLQIVLGTVVGMLVAFVGKLVFEVREMRQTLYGVDGKNGLRSEIRYIGRVVHWLGNGLQAAAFKLGIEISERPERDA